MAGPLEASIYLDGHYNCPCFQGSLQNSTMPSFIGNEYFCESENPDLNGKVPVKLDANNFLWYVKGLVLLKKLVVKFLVSHNSTKSLTLPLQTIL